MKTLITAARKAVVKNVEDRENLNLRREELGLEPIDVYLKQIENAYRASNNAAGPSKSSDKSDKPDDVAWPLGPSTSKYVRAQKKVTACRSVFMP